MMVEDARLLRFYVHLTQRQREIVELAADGLRNDAIGQRLYIAQSVVAGHLTKIYSEMGTLDELVDIEPNRYILIRLFVPFFERHPELRNDKTAV